MSWLGDLWGGLIDTPKGGTSILGQVLPSLITGGLTTVAAMNQPQQQIAYGNTQAGFDAQMAFEKEKLAQEMELARMKLAQGGGDGGSGAALAAARLGARVNLASLREKAMADQLSLSLQGQQMARQSLQEANNSRVNAAQQFGNAGLAGYGRLAQILQGFRT